MSVSIKTYIGPSPNDIISQDSWERYVADKPELKAQFPTRPESYELFQEQARTLTDVIIQPSTVWTGRAGGSGLFVESGGKSSKSKAQSPQSASEAQTVPAEFKQIFDLLPADAELSGSSQLHYYQAYGLNEHRIPVSEIRSHLRGLSQRISAIERQGGEIPEKGSLMLYALGMLINAESDGKGHVQGLTDLSCIEYHYDTLIWQYKIDKLVQDQGSQEGHAAILSMRQEALRDHTMQSLFEMGLAVNQNTSLWLPERISEGERLGAQVQDIQDAVLTARHEMTEIGTEISQTEETIGKTQRIIFYYQYKILKNQIFILSKSGETEQAAALEKTFQEQLAACSLRPEGLVGETDFTAKELGYERAGIAQFAGDVSRARESYLRGLSTEMARLEKKQKTLLSKSTASTEIPELRQVSHELDQLRVRYHLFTDPGAAIAEAVSAYNYCSGIVDVLDTFIKIEEQYGAGNYFDVTSYYEGLDQARLPAEVLEQTQGMVPVLIGGDGTSTADWYFVKRQTDGAFYLAPYSAVVADSSVLEVVDGEVLAEGFAQTSDVMTLAGRGLSLFPQTISQDEYLAMLGRQVQNQESLELAFHNDPSIQQMLSLSADLMERLEGLDAQIMAGTLGFTKDEDYLGALQAQAEYILSYFDENGETLRQVFEGSRETLQRLQGLNLGAQTDDFEQSIQKKIELLTQVEKMFIDSDELIERCQRLLEMTANFTEEQLLQWLKTDGVVFALSIAGAVLVLSGVGAVFGAGIFAGVGGMALSAVIMGAGSVFGQEVGLRVVSTYDARYQSLWQQATKGDITNDELWQGYVSNWGQQALMCFAFMGAGKLVGLGAKSMALSSRPALAGTGRALLSAGGSIQRTLNGIIPGEGAVANFWREYVSELFEESAEQTAQSIDPRLGAIVTTLNSMDGRNIEIAQINMGVTRKGIGVVDGAPVVEFEYEAGKHNEVFEDLKRRYEFSEQHRQELTDNGVTVQDRVRWAGPNVIEVTVPLQGADKTMTYRFTATQEPYFLRRAVAQRIRESQDGLRTHDDYLHDAVGIVPQQAQDVANAGREFRVAEGHTISEVQAAMKKLGFVPFDSNTESVDSYLLFETGNGVVTVYTTPVLQANSSTEKSAIESGPILEEGAVGEGVDQTTDVALAITPDEAGMQHFRTALDQTAQQIPDGTLETTVEIRVDNISDFDPMAVKQQIKEAFSETSVGRVTFVVYDGKTGVRAQQRIDINPEQVAKIPVKTFSADDGRRVAQQLMGDQFEQVQKTVLNWDPEYQERFWTEVARFKDKKQSADSLRPFLRSDSDGSTYGIVPPDTEQEITKRVVESTKVMDDFFSSLTVPMDKGSRSRRINAWPQDVRNFLDTYPPRPADWAQQGTPSSFVDSAGRAQEYFVPDYVVAKFDAWIAKHSFDVTTEVKGYFTTEKRGDVVYLTDFIPQPSMSESVEYHRSDYTSQEAFEKHFGGCQVASKSFPTIVGRGSAPLRDSFLQAVINPEHYVSKANPPDTIDVHSHFIESQFQNSPSTGDFVFFTQPIIMAVRTPNGGLLLFHPKKHLHSMVVAKPLSPAVLADPSVQHHLRATDPNSEFEVYFNPDAAEGERYRFVGSEVGRADMGETIIATDEEGHVTSKTRTDSATTPYGPEWQYVGHAHPSAEGHTVEPSQDDLIRFLQNGQKTHHILRFDPQTGETHWARITLHNTGEITITYSDPAMNTPEAQARFAQNLSDAQAFVADNSLKTGVKTGVKD